MTTFVNNDVASGNVIFAADHNQQGALLAGVLNGNVDATNLADSAVTTSKLSDSGVTTGKINDDAVTPAKWTNPYGFGVTNNTSVNLASATWTKMTWATEDWDTNSNFASSTYTVPVTGIYHFDVAVGMTGATNETLGVAFYKNGSVYRVVNYQDFNTGVSSNGWTSSAFGGSCNLSLTAADTVEVYVYTDDGGDTSSGSPQNNWWNGHLVAPL